MPPKTRKRAETTGAPAFAKTRGQRIARGGFRRVPKHVPKSLEYVQARREAEENGNGNGKSYGYNYNYPTRLRHAALAERASSSASEASDEAVDKSRIGCSKMAYRNIGTAVKLTVPTDAASIGNWRKSVEDRSHLVDRLSQLPMPPPWLRRRNFRKDEIFQSIDHVQNNFDWKLIFNGQLGTGKNALTS